MSHTPGPWREYAPKINGGSFERACGVPVYESISGSSSNVPRSEKC